jgi:tRNA (guanine-N7-)-methyltransferase
MMAKQLIRAVEEMDLHLGNGTLVCMSYVGSMSHVGDLTQRDPHFSSNTAPTTGRSARSFHPRSGRLSPTKHRSIDELLPRYLVEPMPSADLAAVFGREAPCVLDVGFGMGESTLALAAARPDLNILGIDVHIAGLAMVAEGLEVGRLTNVKMVAADAHEVLMWMIPPRSIHEVHIWFSDPWPKTHQQKRRLIQPDFLQLVESRLLLGGRVRMATDWQPYANQMAKAIAATSTLRNEFGSEPGGWAPRDTQRPLTGFERKGIAAGRDIRDLVAVTTES